MLNQYRSTYVDGIISINILGGIHHLVHSPSLVQSLFSQKSSALDYDPVTWRIINKVAGMPSQWKDPFMNTFHDLTHAVTTNLLREPSLGNMIQVTIDELEVNLPQLVTTPRHPLGDDFISNFPPWQRAADALIHKKPADGKIRHASVEANLLPLCLHILGHSSLASIFGHHIQRNYPNLLLDLFEFNYGFLLLAAGIPSYLLPLKRLRNAEKARSHLVEAFTAYHGALDAAVDGRDVIQPWIGLEEDVSKLILDRQKIYRTSGIPIKQRAESDLMIFWALNANANFLIFWMLIRIHATEGLVDRVRREVAPYISTQACSPKNPDGKLKIDVASLTRDCPLLKSCYIESLRMDSAPWSIKKVKSDFQISDGGRGTNNSIQNRTIHSKHQNATRWLLKRDEYVEVPFGMHFMDERFFHDPERFVPERHLVPEIKEAKTDEVDRANDAPREKLVADWSTVRAFGGGKTMCKGRLYAEKEVLTCVAGMLMLWDFEPAQGKEWKVPEREKATAVYMPKQDVRVLIRRRRT